MVEKRTVDKTQLEALKKKFGLSDPKSYFEAQNVVEEYASENGIPILPAIQLERREIASRENKVQNTPYLTNGDSGVRVQAPPTSGIQITQLPQYMPI
jgi:hypothetical protein